MTSIGAITAIPATSGTQSSLADGAAASVQDGGTLNGDIDLADADTKFIGNAPDDDAGHDVAPAGDVNGDGEQDVLVAAPRNNSNGPNSGEVYLFYGPVREGDIDVSEADVTFTGAPGDHAGLSVAAGDVDGDGLGDVVVGAPYNDTGGTNAGAVYVAMGAASLPSEIHLPAEADATYRGEAGFDLLGFSVATVGASGSDSVLAGAPGDDTAGQNAGAAHLVREVSGGDSAIGTAADVTYTGAGDADRAGWSVSAAGDVTGDGWGEVIVGAPRNDSSAFNAGAAYVLATDRTGEVSVTRGLTLEGEAAEDWAGSAVSDAGDVNDDGFGDVVVGAPYNDAAGNDSGAAYVVYGSDGLSGTQALGDADLVLTGESANDRAGWSVSSAGSGDVNCDEFDDVLVGAPYDNSTAANAGAAYLVYGGQDGERSLSTASAKFWGEGEGDLAGWAVDEAEDASGDGLEDVMIGAVDNDTGGEDAGAAYLIQGQCPVEDEEETPTPKDRDTPTPTETPEETPTPTKTPKQTPTEEPLESIHLRTDCEEYKLHNPNTVTVKVHVDGPDDRTVKLRPGEKKRATGVTPGEYTFTAEDTTGDRVQVDGQDSVTTRIEACPTPTPTESPTPTVTDTPTPTETPGLDLDPISVDKVCSDGDGVLELTNPNDVRVTVTVGHPDGTTETVEIGPGSTESITGLADGSYQLKAETTSGGEKVKMGTATVEVDCDVELVGVDIETDCVDGQGEITVTNPNDEPVVVLVDRAAEYHNSTTVQPGESVTFGDLDDGEYNVETINETSREIVALELVDINCDEAGDLVGVEIETDCVDGQGEITVTNPNDEPVIVLVDRAAEYHNSTTVGPGESVTFGDLDDGEYNVETINETSREIVALELVDINCDEGPPRESQDTTAVSSQCEQLTVTNPSGNDENVDFRIRDASSGDLVDTVDDVAPGESRTLQDLTPGEYLVDARFVQDDQFSSDNVTVNGAAEATVGVDACVIACPEDFSEFKVDSGRSSTQSGVELTVAGDGSSATITNTNSFPISVWVWSGSRMGPVYVESETVEPGGSTTVDGITVHYDDQEITHDISNVAITCPGVSKPSIPPYTTNSNAVQVSDEPVDGTTGEESRTGGSGGNGSEATGADGNESGSGDGASGNAAIRGPDTIPVFRLAWATGAVAVMAGLIFRRD